MQGRSLLPVVGDVVAGKYRIDRVLGNGTMGPVMEAAHLALKQPVAIKFLRPDLAGQEVLVARFVREARATAAIRSEHVGRVLDLATLETGAPYMVLELLSGVDLGHLVEDQGALSIDDACAFIAQASDAIGEAHALGIVHRDIKPENLFVVNRADGSSVVKVLDFGVSKFTFARPEHTMSHASVTATGVVLGSLSYMSPEQIRSAKSVDLRSDVWSLGATLYFLLTGRPPFHAPSELGLCREIMVRAPRPISEHKPDVPLPLQQIVERCLEKDTDRRFQTVPELMAALAPFVPKERPAVVHSTVPVVLGGQPSVAEGDFAMRRRAERIPRLRVMQGLSLHGGRRRALIIAAAMGIACSSVVLLAHWGSGAPTPPSARAGLGAFDAVLSDVRRVHDASMAAAAAISVTKDPDAQTPATTAAESEPPRPAEPRRERSSAAPAKGPVRAAPKQAAITPPATPGRDVPSTPPPTKAKGREIDPLASPD